MSEDDPVRCLHRVSRLRIVEAMIAEPSPDVLRPIAHGLAREHETLPISLVGSTLTLAMADPSNVAGLNEITFLSGCDAKVVLAHAASHRKDHSEALQPASASRRRRPTRRFSGRLS